MRKIIRTCASWTAACAVVLAPATAHASADETAPEATAVAVENTQTLGTLDSYWTEERMSQAEPMDPPEVSGGESRDEPAEGVLPAVTAEGERPTGSTGAPSTGADARILQGSTAERWNNQGSMPARTIGQLFFDNHEGDPRRCSASVITSENRNTVWTAGHCLHAGEQGDNGWFDNFAFVPDADNGREPHGRWEWRRAVTVTGWIDGGDNSYDLGAIEFAPQPGVGDLQDVTGAQGYRFGHGQEFDDVHHFGFPENGYQRDDFTGDDLWYCTGPTEDAGWFTDELVQQCDMAQGTSGGPWINELQTERGWGYIIGLNSNSEKDSDGNPVDLNVKSPNHGDAAINVYNDISG